MQRLTFISNNPEFHMDQARQGAKYGWTSIADNLKSFWNIERI
ncbi:MAG: hypothetical protein ACYCOU_14595 [Sulfobacillus sp.]